MPRAVDRAVVLLLALLTACSGAAPSASTSAEASSSSPSFRPTPTATLPGASYVSPDGSDAADGSLSRPWRTLQHAANTASGQVFVAPGRYDGFRITRSWSGTRPLQLVGPGADQATIVPGGGNPDVIHIAGAAHVDISGFTIQGAAAKFAAGIRIDGDAQAIFIHDNRIVDGQSFGIEVSAAHGVTIDDNEIARHEAGIRLIAEGGDRVAEITIAGNEIHDNDRLVVSDPSPDNDFGANGVIAHATTGNVLIIGNTLYGNRGVSVDYGTDGGAFEVWAASNVTITRNTVYDNENVLETGTDGHACDNISFTRNVAFHGDDEHRAIGLILRCASNSLVAHNTLVGLDWFAFDISPSRGQFGGSIEHLRILNNIVADGRAYLIESALPPSVAFDYNLLDPSVRLSPVAPTLASVEGYGAVSDLPTFRELTGQEPHGVAGRPTFVDASAGDYRLAPGSLGVDQGTALDGDTFAGSAPDIGSFESGS